MTIVTTSEAWRHLHLGYMSSAEFELKRTWPLLHENPVVHKSGGRSVAPWSVFGQCRSWRIAYEGPRKPMPQFWREFLEWFDDARTGVSARGAGEDYALVIGVNDYPQLRPLRGAIADAQAFAAWLLDAEGGALRSENVRTILSTADPVGPIGYEINDALEDVFQQAGRTGGRRFYFYFSGHGCVGDRANDLALCLANWSSLRRRAALSSEAWLDVVVRSGIFDEVAFFLDCCRVWAVRAVGLPPHIDFPKPVERERGTRVFLAYATEFQHAAAEVDTYPTSAQRESRGIFTQVLIEGLRGMARGVDGTITAAMLKHHVEKATEQKARELGFCQRAEVLNGFDHESRFGGGHQRAEAARWWVSRPFKTLSSRTVVGASDDLTPSVVNTLERLQEWGQDYERFRHRAPRPMQRLEGWYPRGLSRLQLIVFSGEYRAWRWMICGRYQTMTNICNEGSRSNNEVFFSADLLSGEYILRCDSKFECREIAAHVYPGWSTVIVIDNVFRPHFENARIFLIPYVPDETLPEWSAVQHMAVALTLLHSTSTPAPATFRWLDPSAPVVNPLLSLLVAHLMARWDHPDANGIDLIASNLESLLGTCPDVHALRLRAALIRGGELPSIRSTDPPMLREGLLAFVEASHRIPDLVPSKSKLEVACIGRFTDSPLSSWNDPSDSSDGWLSAAIENEVVTRRIDMGTLDATTIARQIGVPTSAVTACIQAKRERFTQNNSALLSLASALTSDSETQPMSDKRLRDRSKVAIPDYSLERVIGNGGMGIVYLAKRISTGDRIAVKVVEHKENTSQTEHWRFLREIEALSVLQHDRIVTLLDHGEADFILYFAMPYYEHGNVADWVHRNGQLGLRDAVRLIQDVLDGLAYVHKSGYVHRDIKPQNILMDKGRAILADFGLVKYYEMEQIPDDSEGINANVISTLKDTFLGTLAFMPREQPGNFKRLRPSSDVWAVAAVLYWLLCGVVPRDIRGKDTRSRLESMLSTPATPIRARLPLFPKALGDLLDAALSDNPDKRPADATEFRSQLEYAINKTFAAAK